MPLEPGELPDKDKLIPIKRADGVWELDRVRCRRLNGDDFRQSAQGRTKKECGEEWMRRWEVNIRKGSKRKRVSKRVQFSPNDKMSLVFATLDAQWKARVEDGTLSVDTYNNYRLMIYPAPVSRRNHNPDAYKLEVEMGGLTITEAADVADLIDYLDEVVESAPSRAEMQHLILGMAFRLAVVGRAIPTAHNPMPDVPCPPRRPTEPRPLAQSQCRALYVYFAGLRRTGSAYLRLYFLILLGTGVRPGEGLAFRWIDRTLETLEDGSVRRVLYVGATVRRRTGLGSFRHGSRKSGNPYRIVLPRWLDEELDAQYALVREAVELAQASREDKDRMLQELELQPIIVGPVSGSWVSVPAAQEVLLAVRDDGPVPDFRLSDVRDTVATYVAAATKDDARSSAQLGHTEGKESIAQKFYIADGVKRLAVVDNADVLERLNPMIAGGNWESDGTMSGSREPNRA